MSLLFAGKTLDEVNLELENVSTPEILCWAWTQFAPAIAATSSFQSQSLPLLHIIASVVPQLEVFFIDTGFHFPETLTYRDNLIIQLKLRVRSLSPSLGHIGFLHKHGNLYRHDPDLCCYINKVEPLRLAKKGLNAWITGIRRDQTETRSNAQVVTLEKDGTYKICPMLNWTSKDVWRYIYQHELPVHPLLQQGYMSIGCAPCTLPVQTEGDEREGRWAGTVKKECGLHTLHDIELSNLK